MSKVRLLKRDSHNPPLLKYRHALNGCIISRVLSSAGALTEEAGWGLDRPSGHTEPVPLQNPGGETFRSRARSVAKLAFSASSSRWKGLTVVPPGLAGPCSSGLISTELKSFRRLLDRGCRPPEAGSTIEALVLCHICLFA